MRIVLDPNLCDGNGLCVNEAPDFFELNDDEELTLLKEEVGPEDAERVRKAVNACPKAALRLE